MKVYKKQVDHVKQKAGSGDLADFFAWALRLARRDEADRVMVEMPTCRIVWTAVPKVTKKRLAKKASRKRKGGT